MKNLKLCYGNDNNQKCFFDFIWFQKNKDIGFLKNLFKQEMG